MRKIIMFIFLSTLMQVLNAASLSPVEKKIANHVTANQEEQIALLKKLVNINSETSNINGVHKVGELLQAEFNKLGFKTWWIEEPNFMHRAGTLMAERQGSTGKKLLLIGHLDTVFPANRKLHHFERQGHFATGPGVLDMKGGDVVMVYALKALNEVGALNNATIKIVLTGDEEDSGKPLIISRKPLFEAARHSDVALDFEHSISKDTATIARRGISKWTVETEGQEGHSSQIFQPSMGSGAIFELARILDTLRNQFAKENNLTFNPGLILGGNEISFDKNLTEGKASGKDNVIAKTAVATGDIRFLSSMQKSKAMEKMKSIVKGNLPGTQSNIVFQTGIPAMQPSAANLNLLKEYSAVSELLGFGKVKPLPVGLRGAGDISHIASIVAANLAGLGPVGVGAHSIQEKLDINSLPIQTTRAAVLMYRLVQ
ncbi:MAG: M20/M25/M40 family metallo-hydrolase [Tatlockia sp.]|nr:M20/M25/M40 family metallo-hydrolase [Tatlockia sp.]